MSAKPSIAVEWAAIAASQFGAKGDDGGYDAGRWK
jgi:hypothetical protein